LLDILNDSIQPQKGACILVIFSLLKKLQMNLKIEHVLPCVLGSMTHLNVTSAKFNTLLNILAVQKQKP